MLQEFQILYRPRLNSEAPLSTVVVRAETADEARGLVESQDWTAHSVGPGHPVMDWNKRTFDAHEAAVYLAISIRKIYELQDEGSLPRPTRRGVSIFSLEELERFRRSRMVYEAKDAKSDQRKAA